MSKENLGIELSPEVMAIKNMAELAYNLKPKSPKKTGKTRAETMELIDKLVIEIQKKMIGYECLQAAVKLSKDNKGISKKAIELIDVQIQLLTSG